jgi:hypothetical protein
MYCMKQENNRVTCIDEALELILVGAAMINLLPPTFEVILFTEPGSTGAIGVLLNSFQMLRTDSIVGSI